MMELDPMTIMITNQRAKRKTLTTKSLFSKFKPKLRSTPNTEKNLLTWRGRRIYLTESLGRARGDRSTRRKRWPRKAAKRTIFLTRSWSIRMARNKMTKKQSLRSISRMRKRLSSFSRLAMYLKVFSKKMQSSTTEDSFKSKRWALISWSRGRTSWIELSMVIKYWWSLMMQTSGRNFLPKIKRIKARKKKTLIRRSLTVK